MRDECAGKTRDMPKKGLVRQARWPRVRIMHSLCGRCWNGISMLSGCIFKRERLKKKREATFDLIRRWKMDSGSGTVGSVGGGEENIQCSSAKFVDMPMILQWWVAKLSQLGAKAVLIFIFIICFFPFIVVLADNITKLIHLRLLILYLILFLFYPQVTHICFKSQVSLLFIRLIFISSIL